MNKLQNFRKYKKYEMLVEMNPKVVSSSLAPATKETIKPYSNKNCKVFLFKSLKIALGKSNIDKRDKL